MYVRAMRRAGLLMWLGISSLHGQVRWIHPFGSRGSDSALGVTSDTTGVYVIGATSGVLPGQSSAGSYDAFIRKCDSSGTELWTRQFGSSSADYANGVATNATGVYVVGYTLGVLPGQTSAGIYDAFVRKYDASGTELWTRQFGTSSDDEAYGVAADATGVYVVGYTDGVLPGTAGAGGADAFVRRYDANGTELWTRQFGSSASDYASGVIGDATGVYVVGETLGILPGQTSAGNYDVFVRKYDSNGSELWTRQFGSSSSDYANGVASDTAGVSVVGYTGGVLPGQTGAGGNDAFVRRYATNGAELSTLQFGTLGFDSASGVVGGQALYVVGTLGMTSANGGENAFIFRLR